VVGCHYFPPGLQLPPQPLRGLRRDCDLNPGPSAPESSTLTTRLPSHPKYTCCEQIFILSSQDEAYVLDLVHDSYDWHPTIFATASRHLVRPPVVLGPAPLLSERPRGQNVLTWRGFRRRPLPVYIGLYIPVMSAVHAGRPTDRLCKTALQTQQSSSRIFHINRN